MTTPNLEQVIAKAINDDGWTCEAHEPHDFGECTRCRDSQLRTAAHVAAAIRDSGLTVIALPEPSEYLPGDLPSWSRVISVAVDRFNEVVVGRTWWINRHEARDLAAALLAAARIAEQN